MLKLNEELKDKISYSLIGLVLLSFLLPLLLGYSSNGGIFLIFQFAAVFSLAVFYALTAEKKDLFFITLVLFALQQISSLSLYYTNGMDLASANNAYTAFMIFDKLPFVFSALAFGILAYKHSKEFKAFEMMEFLLVIFLIAFVALGYMNNSALAEYSKYLIFGICFLIATLMYNNNLWMRYEDTQKDLLIFLLVLTFAYVIQVSAKFISF